MSIFDQSIFRAYDIRGTYPNQLNEDVAYAAGQAFVHIMGAKTVVVGRDVRSTGPNLEEALIRGVTDAGANAIKIGIISTEMLYYACATMECDGGMSITASHNPPQWNGIKLIGQHAVPITRNDKLVEIFDFINSGQKLSQFEKGSVTERDLLDEYTQYLRENFGPKDLPQLKIVANTNFGANGKIIDKVINGWPIELVRLNWNEDGSFPKGTPDPLLPHNSEETEQRVQAEHAHFGAAWDADADRVFFYDETGRDFHSYYINAMLAEYFLKKHPGATIINERRLQWASQDVVKELGGKLVYCRPGHGYIKAAMRENDAIYGGETSGHYYFKDFFSCDNGMVAFLTVLGIFAEQIKKGGTVGELLDPYIGHYPIIQHEQNFIAERGQEIIKAVIEKYDDGEEHNDGGFSVDFPTWHFSLRLSDNEPVMRLNLEARTYDELEERKTELMTLITSFGAELRNDN